MARRKPQTLESWIHEALTDEDKDQKCTGLSLVYVKANGSFQELHSINIQKKVAQPDQLAEIFTRKAESFSADLDGVSDFQLQAFYGQKDPQAWKPFKCFNGELRLNGAEIPVTESPDNKGLTHQLMRHLEETQRMFMAFTQGVIVKQMDDRQSLQREVFEAYELVRNVTMKQLELDHAKLLDLKRYERETQNQKVLLQLAPGLVNAVTGTELLPQGQEDSTYIDMIARKIKPEHVQMMVQMGLIPQEMVGPLMARLKRTLDRDEKEREAVRNAPPANPDPNKDSAGD